VKRGKNDLFPEPFLYALKRKKRFQQKFRRKGSNKNSEGMEPQGKDHG